MGKWKIAKQFDFCYGHRVWSQKLDKEYSLDDRCVCRHLHGHQGKIIVNLESIESKLPLTNGMVTDFKHLNWFKKFIDDTLDHKFIVDENDPMFDFIIPVDDCTNDAWSLMTMKEGYKIIDPEIQEVVEPDFWDILEGFVIVDFLPTSENLSAWLARIVNIKMAPLGVKCSHLQFYETPKSQSNYYS